MATAYWEAIAVNQSTNQPPDGAEAYERLVKFGDAVETPDGELWVVEAVLADELVLVSAYRDAVGLVYADPYEATHTVIPRKLARKVADARAVRR